MENYLDVAVAAKKKVALASSQLLPGEAQEAGFL